jgi:exodeoxyribonuclease V gamma subunit
MTITFSRVSPRHRLASWVRLLAATVTHPGRAFSAVTVGRSARGATVTVARIPPLADDPSSRREVALGELTVLVDLYERGMREPLPLFCLSSAAYARAVIAGDDPVAAARTEWTSGWRFEQEDRELEHRFVLGGVSTIEELLSEPPREGESGPGWRASESSRFGRLALRMWEGLLSREELTSR